MLPEEGIREVTLGGGTFLLRNEAMFTALQHAQGEFSEFFLSLRDEKKIFGHRCSRCRHLIVPPFMKRCPPCDFAEMEKEYVKDVGVMAASPVITVFAPARFKDQVPFGTGRVFLEAQDGTPASTAMLVRVRTTLGTIRPGICQKGTPVKIVFSAHCKGAADDIFAVPQSELTPAQIAKSPLTEDEIEWDRMPEAERKSATAQDKAALKEAASLFRKLADLVRKSPRATADLANWRRRVHLETRAGAFAVLIDNGRLEVGDDVAAAPDLIFRIHDPAVLVAWLRATTAGAREAPHSPPLTDLVVEGTLILNRPEMETITRLDRIPRSLRRDSILK
jgi:uncharacterized OB-fold protein